MASERAIKVPDIGGASGVDVIELLVKPGDTIAVDTPLITLESDKASMEIPSTAAGVVKSLALKLGDKVSEGDVILILETADAEAKPAEEPVKEAAVVEAAAPLVVESAPVPEALDEDEDVYAGPGVRRLARSLGIALNDVPGSGRHDRISREDLELYIKHQLTSGSKAPNLSFAAAPAIDFSQFGAVETKPLNKIKRLTGINVHRAWVSIPHVTQFDQADVTDLEAFRQAEGQRAQAQGYKLTLLAFVCKVVVQALKAFPQFNASLDPSGEQLIYKQYFNLGIAVETPNGLVVPVIKGVDSLSVADIAKEMARLSQKARDKGLMPGDMSGGCFTVSSLGGIGGTAFTPIVNSPEVAILGLSRSSYQPVYQNGAFVPRLMLPLSLSYDHRVIDGAEGARFTRFVSEHLADIRRILL